MLDKLNVFVESKLGGLILGFLLTTIAGSTLNYFYQKATWQREKDYEILKIKAEETKALVSNLSEILSKRAFRLERVIWALDDQLEAGERFSNSDYEILDQRWEEYYQSVIEWNEKFRSLNSKLYLLLGEEAASTFYIDEMESKKQEPTTIYGNFRSAHTRVRKLYICVKNKGCENGREILEKAESTRDVLYEKIDSFLILLNRSYHEL